MSRLSRSLLALAAMSTLAAAPLGTAFAADGQWAKTHPRRAEVNARLAHQDRRIDREVRQGEITPRQGAALHREDRRIRREERLMASRHDGHITRGEQRALNQQENAVSRQIGH